VGIVDQFASSIGEPAERLIDTRGIAELLGVTRQRVGQLAKRDATFPRPTTRLSGGAIW
jgi:predicted DNA-binding transcriptional regulator AlpA